jgi:hypothetical protein
MCSINNEVTHANIITQEGFTQLEGLGVLENDTDISKMAKRMATHTQAEGRVLLGMVMIKRLQTLVWWVRDQQKRGLTLNAADSNAGTMNQASEMKTLRRKRAKKNCPSRISGSLTRMISICMKTPFSISLLNPLEFYANLCATLCALR